MLLDGSRQHLLHNALPGNGWLVDPSFLLPGPDMGACCGADLKLKLDLALTEFVNKHSGSMVRRQNNQYLTGNFAPVQDAVHVQDLPVEGVIPKVLEGVFVRTGPNPKFTPLGDYHCEFLEPF